MSKFIEVYDLECLTNVFTYTGYDVTHKKWYQFVIANWRNDYKELVIHLKQEGMIQVGFNNEDYDYPIEHHLLNHVDEYMYLTGFELSQRIYAKSQFIIEQEFSAIADRNKFIPQIDLFKIWHYNNPFSFFSTKLSNISSPLVTIRISTRLDNSLLIGLFVIFVNSLLSSKDFP